MDLADFDLELVQGVSKGVVVSWSAERRIELQLVKELELVNGEPLAWEHVERVELRSDAEPHLVRARVKLPEVKLLFSARLVERNGVHVERSELHRLVENHLVLHRHRDLVERTHRWKAGKSVRLNLRMLRNRFPVLF